MNIRLNRRKADIVGAGPGFFAFQVIARIMSVVRSNSFAPASATISDQPIVGVSQRNRPLHPDALAFARRTVVHIRHDDSETHHGYVKSSVMNFDSGEQPVEITVDLEFDHRGTLESAVCNPSDHAPASLHSIARRP